MVAAVLLGTVAAVDRPLCQIEGSLTLAHRLLPTGTEQHLFIAWQPGPDLHRLGLSTGAVAKEKIGALSDWTMNWVPDQASANSLCQD